MSTGRLSAFQAAMEMVNEVHGPLSGRERQIAETAARTAYQRAMREAADLMMDRADAAR
jgi:hypothetical protein